MKKGLLHRILVKRYGEFEVTIHEGFIEHCWNGKNDYTKCILYRTASNAKKKSLLTSLEEIYGDYIGGFLLGDSLKIASLYPQSIFGLYMIDELHSQPEIQHALTLNPAVQYFMDAANVWYYGTKGGELFVYDSETDELDSLGSAEIALENLLDEWEKDA